MGIVENVSSYRYLLSEECDTICDLSVLWEQQEGTLSESEIRLWLGRLDSLDDMKIEEEQ